MIAMKLLLHQKISKSKSLLLLLMHKEICAMLTEDPVDVQALLTFDRWFAKVLYLSLALLAQDLSLEAEAPVFSQSEESETEFHLPMEPE
jgi:hypothetical protein